VSEEEGMITRLVARVRALLFEDWRGRAGERFRATVDEIGEFAEEHRVRPGHLASEGVELGRKALHGKANKDLAAATRDFAQAEQIKIENELKRRSGESEVRRQEAEARLAEIKVLDAEVELLRKMQEIGVVPHRDENGNITVLPLPEGCHLEQLVQRKLLAAEQISENALVSGTETETRSKAAPRFKNENLNRSVEELELTVRSYNCLKNANVQTVGELVQKTEAEMLRTKNLGRRHLNEIKKILASMGLSLGMKIDEQGNAVPGSNRAAATPS
jgi:hypothetical protein